MLVPWTPLAPSARERALRRIGVALALASAAALLAGAARAEPLDPFTAIAVLLALLGVAFATRSPSKVPIEVGVDRSGSLTVRRTAAIDLGPEPGECVFAAPWLITVKRGTMLVPIWPDSLPGNTYRRLWVHIRWGSGRPPADLPAGTAPGQPG